MKMGKITGHLKSFLFIDSYGAMATGSFLICALSGIFLAIPYDINAPYLSISYFMILNPAASFTRNIHYWSAQTFLVLTLLHVWQHISSPLPLQQSRPVWFRLIAAFGVTFFVMLSGFILKGDADSQNARIIIQSLISEIPFAGNFVAYSLLGKSSSYQLIYVHHIATATIFLVIVIKEHAHSLWIRKVTFLKVLSLLVLISWFLQAPLHDQVIPGVKGPWYFAGLQELLHWLPWPQLSWIIFVSILAVIYFLPQFQGKAKTLVLRGLLASFVAYILLSVTGVFLRAENWAFTWPWNNPQHLSVYSPMNNIWNAGPSERGFQKDFPTILGRKESCMGCHGMMAGLSPSHDPKAIGCASCHLGNSFTSDKKQAHRGMILIPGNLAKASLTCGSSSCHREITDRISATLMTTLSGMVSVDRYVFGEQTTTSVISDIRKIGHSPSDRHLRELCAGCHLANPKIELGPVTELSRGGGCNACHISYDERSEEALKTYLNQTEKTKTSPVFHPAITLKVTDDHCFGCHSRSGRISTNYEGWHETLLSKKEMAGKKGLRLLEDGRVFTKMNDDIHHRKGLECIDCHNSQELMGDGKLHLHEEEQVTTRCEGCHFAGNPVTTSIGMADLEGQKIWNLRKFIVGNPMFIKSSVTGKPILNVVSEGKDSVFMLAKNSGKRMILRPPAAACLTGKAHNALACSACHTGWAPRCIGCHNSFDANAKGFDHLTNKTSKGSWMEFAGIFMADEPTLGVRSNQLPNGKLQRQVITVVPGMILTIDKPGYTKVGNSTIFHRLYAPAEPHTTQKAGRNCVSCHNSPLALGYGYGNLSYKTVSGNGRWEFTPRFAPNPHDGLPEDAWIGFLDKRTKDVATRGNVNPFNLEEQRRILTAGACLTCHDGKSEVMEQTLYDFNKTIKARSSKCILPEW